MFPNLDSSRIHSSQNCQARAAWIPAGSALEILSHITEHNLESFYFAVGCAKILDVQYEINWSKAVPSWHVVLGPRDQLGAGRRRWMALAHLPWSQALHLFRCWELRAALCLVTLCRCHSKSPRVLVVMATLKKKTNFLIESEGTHSGKYTEVSQTKAFLLQAVQDMTQGTRLNKQGQIKWTGFTWTRKHCCWWWIEYFFFFFQPAELICANC